MASQSLELTERKGDRLNRASSFNDIAAAAWNMADMRSLAAKQSYGMPEVFGNVDLIAQAPTAAIAPSTEAQPPVSMARGMDGFEIVDERNAIAWDPREWASKTAKQTEHAAKEHAHQIERHATYAKSAIGNEDLQYREKPPEGGNYWYPHRTREDDFVSYPACASANMPFENLRMRLGTGPGHVNPNLIAAIMRNEQFYYKQGTDTGQDNYVRTHGNLDIVHDETYSIGPAQMQIRNAKHLLEKFPDQLGQYKNDPLRALERPGDAPLFVAAYISDMINHLETGKNPGFSNGVWNNIVRHWKAGDANGALILSFNPDVNQIEHINRQLKIIENQRTAN